MSKQPNILEAEMRVNHLKGKEQEFLQKRLDTIQLHLKLKKKYEKASYFERLEQSKKLNHVAKNIRTYNQWYEDLRLLERI